MRRTIYIGENTRSESVDQLCNVSGETMNQTMDIVRERTPEERKSFVEGFNTCLSGMKSDLAVAKSLQESIEHEQIIASLIEVPLRLN